MLKVCSSNQTRNASSEQKKKIKILEQYFCYFDFKVKLIKYRNWFQCSINLAVYHFGVCLNTDKWGDATPT